MKIVWILVVLNGLLLAYIIYPSNSSYQPPRSSKNLEKLRQIGCASSLLSQNCLDFYRPSSKDCQIGFTFSALLDIRLRFTDFVANFPPPNEAKIHEKIITKQDMLETLAYAFSTGRAAEFRVSLDLFQEILGKIENIENWKTLGGNGATMSNRAALEGCQSYLIAPVSKEMTGFFMKKVQFFNEIIEKPDFHVILEYREGENWGKYQAPRSNRFYMNHDIENVRPNLFDSVPLINDIKILVIGGLQLIENSDSEDEFLEKALSTSIAVKSKSIKTHIEMGDFHTYSYFNKLQSLFRSADSIGMNEQELGILLCHLKKIKFAGYPSKATIRKYLEDLNDLIGELEKNNYQANRIHLHTISVQVICSTDVWNDPLMATVRSALIAGQFACNNTDIQHNSFGFYEGNDWAQDDITKCWKKNKMQCCLALVPTCLNVVQVSGLGDNISATGLAYHRINE